MSIFLDRESLRLVLEDINQEEGTSFELENDLFEKFNNYVNKKMEIEVHRLYKEYKQYFLAFQRIDRFLRESYLMFNRDLNC